MAERKESLVSPMKFPDQFATDAEKESVSYGLKVGQAIQYEWFKRDGAGCAYYDRWTEFYERRLYARGEQNIERYKDRLKVNGDLSYLNLDWKPVPIIPKFVDIVVNGMQDRMFTPKAFAVDGASAEKRNSYQETIEADMVAKDFLAQTEQEFGVNAYNVEPDEIPADDQELELHMQLKYKPAIEIAEETAIHNVLEMNEFQEVRTRFNYDVTVLGIGIVKHGYSYNEGITADYVDAQNVVHSYSEDPHFKDLFYLGEIKQVHIGEIKKIKPTITDIELNEIATRSSAWNEEYKVAQPYNNDMFQKDVVNLVYFNYKTDKKFIYKKKKLDNGGERTRRRDESFNPPEDQDNAMFERFEKTEDVWYEGVMVLGTEIMLKWELQANMVRPDSAFQRAYSNYIMVAPRMYKGRIESIVTRSMSFADQIQLVHLKLQQVSAKVVPNGVFIDADGLAEVDLGNGAAYSPAEALNLFFQTGSVIGRSYTSEGEYNNAKVPIQEISSNSGQDKIASLIGLYNHYLNMIRDVTGLNEARDASNPDPNSLVGLQKLAALNSNVATRHILDAGLYMTKKLSECISLRISDVLEYSEDREEFANQIGKYNVSILEEIKNLYLHSFGIYIEVSPDEDDKANLEANIQTALQRDQINLEDAIDIREVKNIKTANELLKLKRRKKEEKDQAAKEQEMQMQGQINQQSAEAAAQAKMMQIDAEKNAKIETIYATTESEIRKMNEEVTLKERLMDKEFNFNMQLKGIETDSLTRRETEKEDRKDKRTELQANQQSKMIQQRKDGTPPVNFESNEDSLDGFGTEEFGPK